MEKYALRPYESIDSEYKWFFRRLNEERVRLGYTYEDLSCLTGIDKGNLCRIFNYKHVPSVKMLIRILDALNLRIALKYGFLYPFM